FQQPGIDLEMRDDGGGGDKVAGDGIYSLTLQASQITSGLQPRDVFRRFIGFTKVFQGSTLVVRINTFAEIITDEIPRLPVTVYAQDVQYTPYVVNIVDSNFFTDFNVDRVTKRFYQAFPDQYDFLSLVYGISHIQNRVHMVVKNEVQGIGLRQSDSSGRYGSSGTLKGITFFPNTGFFDGANRGFSHELGHQWINFLNLPPFSEGIPHWPLSDLAAGIMGWSIGTSREGGSFPCKVVPEPGGVRLLPPDGSGGGFQDLELYLMGLVPADQVGAHVIFADQQKAMSLVGDCHGQLYTEPVITVGISDIVNALGPRSPDASTSQKVFRVATILITRDGLLNEDGMAFFSFFAQRAEATTPLPIHEGFGTGTSYPFSVNTGMRASLVARIVDSAAPDFALTFDQTTVAAERGTRVRVPVNINRSNGFTGAVTVTPPDPSMGIKPKPPVPITTSDSTAVFKLKVGEGASPGPHVVTFTGSDSSGRTRSASLTVVVQ
ncbi:MAG TPA: choice-of-anchor X domain-containing protein, partial [Blastocatellia bacterium]|nr:choice-of-anchor X domain-containing protein [Blastocatellia bacterium]